MSDNVLQAPQKPRLVSGIQKKLESRCLDYARDFLLHCYWHDLLLAKKLTALVSMADRHKVAPDMLADDLQQFSGFWAHQQTKLEDVVRRKRMFPNLFFTIAPAEWTFPLHAEVFGDLDLSLNQALFTAHAYHSLDQVLQRLLTNQFPVLDTGVVDFGEFTYRFEFQARGTLHVHVLSWAILDLPASEVSGRTGTASASPLLKLLEACFSASIDVQAGDSEHCLLRYVAGYVAKSSDCVSFSAPADASSAWRQVWRLLQKVSPLWQELALEFWALPLVAASWHSFHIYAPLPGVPHRGFHGGCYIAYLHRKTALEDLSFLHFLRAFPMKKDKTDVVPGERRGTLAAVGVTWPFELLDTFWGAFMAMHWPHRLETDLLLSDADTTKLPPHMHFFWAAVMHARHNGHPTAVLREVMDDLHWRGLNDDRLTTFQLSFEAKVLLVRTALAGQLEAACWARRVPCAQVCDGLLTLSSCPPSLPSSCLLSS